MYQQDKQLAAANVKMLELLEQNEKGVFHRFQCVMSQ